MKSGPGLSLSINQALSQWRIVGLTLMSISFMIAVWLLQIENQGRQWTPKQVSVEEVSEKLAALNSSESVYKFGLFVQSIEYRCPTDVTLSGYYWLRKTNHSTFNLDSGDIVFPEAIKIQMSDTQIKNKDDGDVLQGWYFESTLRQEPAIGSYPFDQREVLIRIWLKDFSQKSILSLDQQAHSDKHGLIALEKTIVLSSFIIKESFFDYSFFDDKIRQSEKLAFGVPDSSANPLLSYELRYNIRIQRNSLEELFNAFVPIIMVLLFVYVYLLSNTGYKLSFGFRWLQKLRSSIWPVVYVCFLVYSHYRLRQTHAFNDFQIIDGYFLVAYFAIISSVRFGVTPYAYSSLYTNKHQHSSEKITPTFVVGALVDYDVLVSETSVIRYYWLAIAFLMCVYTFIEAIFFFS
ncbi:hypothetical protein [Pleionea litopenaei]|uniref:Uncharacterized protein n=1 Tax=Pleionea litopenaei TaxID=3070815 RepID=A0AA51RTK8_9GAMM|nr:hypothetical protein [Pleionea sp. HL-JVS1]WMS87347.1 hypothetical protein Q9312_00105 [Pleionea sp. HL-JVS1]